MQGSQDGETAMTAEEREAVRETLVVVDAIVQRTQRRLNQIYSRTVELQRPFSIPKLRNDIEEIRSMLADIPHKKETLLKVLKMQEKI